MAEKGSGKGGGPPTLAQRPLDPEQMFRVAAGYEEAADLIDQHATASVMAGGPAPTLIPRAMLSAFTLELYLKCLVLLETGGSPRGHGIVELFGEVSPTGQANIRKEFQARVGGNPAFVFDSFLSNVDNAFQQWRYYHEYHPTTGAQSHPIYLPVKQVILAIRPDWQGIYPRS